MHLFHTKTSEPSAPYTCDPSSEMRECITRFDSIYESKDRRTEDVSIGLGQSLTPPVELDRHLKMGSTPERHSDLQPAYRKLVPVGGDQLDKRGDLVEARSARNRLRTPVPFDEPRLVELWEVSVV